MEEVKKVSKQTLWQILDKGITTFCTVIILGLVSRVYGTEGTGVFTLSLTLLSLLYLGIDLGFSIHMLGKSQRADFPFLWQKLFGLRLTLAVVLTVSVFFITFLLPLDPKLKGSILLGVFSILGVAIFQNSNLIFQSRLRFDLFTLASSIGSVFTLLMVFIFVSQKYPVPYLLIAHTLGWFVAALVALFLARRFISVLPKFDWNFTKRLFGKVWPLSLTLVFNVLYFRIDAFILASVKSFSDVGIYNVSYQIFQSLLVIPTYIMNSFYPLMVRDFSQKRNKFILNLKKTALLLLLVSCTGTILTILFAPLAINIITGGKGFSGSISALRILSLGFPAFFLSSVMMWTLVIFKKYKTLLAIGLMGLGFNVLANFIFIPGFSYIGAAIVTDISEYLILSLQLVILIPILKNEKN